MRHPVLAAGENLVDAEGRARELRPVVLQEDGGWRPADITARAWPGFNQALCDQDLQCVLGRRLADAVVGDDGVP
jgi:hypothetical protein